MSTSKPTPGPWSISGATVVWSPSARAVIAEASELRSTIDVRFTRAEFGSPNLDEICANAHLIAEAGTVYHETGLTPRELLAQRDELREALKRLRAFSLWIKDGQDSCEAVAAEDFADDVLAKSQPKDSA